MNDLINKGLANPYFQEFIIPLLTVVFTVAVKAVSRRDKFIGLTKDDFAIGFDLWATSLVLLITYSSTMAADLYNTKNAEEFKMIRTKLEVVPWLLFFLHNRFMGLINMRSYVGLES